MLMQLERGEKGSCRGTPRVTLANLVDTWTEIQASRQQAKQQQFSKGAAWLPLSWTNNSYRLLFGDKLTQTLARMRWRADANSSR